MAFQSIGEVANQIVDDVGAPDGVEIIRPADRGAWLAARQKDVTASVAGCLLGVHPYTTAYGLWASKSGRIPDDEDNPAMRRGRLLEPVAIEMLREDRPDWSVTYRRDNAYWRDPASRIGATPDASAVRPDKPGRGNVQIKTASDFAFAKSWVDPDTKEIGLPLWIAVQAIIEADLTGAQWAAVAVMVVGRGIELHVVDVPLRETAEDCTRTKKLMDRLRAEVAAFWRMVESGQQPEADWKRDGKLIEALYEPTGEIISLEQDNSMPALCDEKDGLSAQKSAADKRLKEIKAEILAKLNGASGARIADGRLITAKEIHRKGYEVQPSSYIDVRVKAA